MNDDLQIHPGESEMWGTATVKFDLTHKCGKHDTGDLRWTFVMRKIKGKWLIVHESQIVPELQPSPNDVVIVKKRYSAFYGTSLDEILGRLLPDALILAGINTHACIRTTAVDAYQRDWPVVLATDCIDSYDKEHHEISLRYMRDKIATVLTNQQIRIALGL